MVVKTIKKTAVIRYIGRFVSGSGKNNRIINPTIIEIIQIFFIYFLSKIII